MLTAKVTLRAGEPFHLSGDSRDLEALRRSLHAICDEDYLFHHQSRRARISELKHLPEYLRYAGRYAKAALKARDDFAAQQGVDPESLGPAWPEGSPKY